MTKARENTLIPAKHNKTRSEMEMRDEERERDENEQKYKISDKKLSEYYFKMSEVNMQRISAWYNHHRQTICIIMSTTAIPKSQCNEFAICGAMVIFKMLVAQ